VGALDVEVEPELGNEAVRDAQDMQMVLLDDCAAALPSRGHLDNRIPPSAFQVA